MAEITSKMEADREKRATDEERQRWKNLRQCKNSNFIDYLKASGVPVRFLNVLIKKIEGVNGSCFITGSCGTGKTHIAVGSLKYFVQQLPCRHFQDLYLTEAIFITVPELLMKIRSCFSLNDCEETIVNKYSSIPFLVLDDLGVEKTSDWALQTLYIIINTRYSNCFQTVITSNFSVEEIAEKLGDRIASRITGMCDIINLTGKDRRVK